MTWRLTRIFQTKTQNDDRRSIRRARRPQLESLEGRIVQSVLFGAYSNGVYAYNSSNGSRTLVTPRTPNVMTEGSSGTLFMGMSDGVYEYTYANRSLNKISPYTASVMSAARDNTLFATLNGRGTWEYNGDWHVINIVFDAYELAAVSNGRVYAGYHDGLWAYNQNTWTPVTPYKPVAMSATSDSTLFVSFNDLGGITYRFNGSWQKITGHTALAIDAVSDSSMFCTFANGGTFQYQEGNGLLTISGEVSPQIGSDGSTFVGDFSSGTYIYQNGHSHKVSSDQASQFA
jgi:hypothetical protein